ncbi:hypothetical protein N665_1201s0002 [Sinapis alba]|nr:hypothetical protein N665_1201s0002 [Sinapis alba]
MTKKNGDELKKIIQKELIATDVSRGHDRLSMPCRNIIDLEFLSPTEQRIIEEDKGKKHMTGVDAKLVKFDVNLGRWKMMKKKKRGNHTFVYNLIRWKQVVKCEVIGLKKSDKICLCSFYSDGKFYFALTTLPPPPHSRSSDSRNDIPEEIGYASVIIDKDNDDLPPK